MSELRKALEDGIAKRASSTSNKEHPLRKHNPPPPEKLPLRRNSGSIDNKPVLGCSQTSPKLGIGFNNNICVIETFALSSPIAPHGPAKQFIKQQLG